MNRFESLAQWMSFYVAISIPSLVKMTRSPRSFIGGKEESFLLVGKVLDLSATKTIPQRYNRELRLGPRTPRAIALGSKPLGGSSVRSHSACRPGDEAAESGDLTRIYPTTITDLLFSQMIVERANENKNRGRQGNILLGRD